MKHAARTLLRVFVPAVLLLIAISPAAAEVTRVEVKTRADVGSSGYEKIVGTVHFAVDPRNPRNRVIVDLDKAPVNAAGRVEFSADLYILRPKDRARSNGMALVDVVNRGRKTILASFNRGGTPDPATEADLGDGFLMKRGFTLVWVGWQFDVDRANGLMGIQVPAASGATGMVKAQFVPNDKKPEQSVGGLAGYTPADPAAADATLTVRDGPFGKPSTIARDRWQLEGRDRVRLAGGFEPGRTYEVSYRAAKLPVAGLGFAAFRDVISWLKHAPGAQAHAQYAIAFGSSQSGRFLRTFLYYGFNTDEHGAQALDGLMAHIAGASRLSLNERGAAPNTLGMWTATGFPFTNAALRDPISGRTEGLLDNDRARQNQPKMFFTQHFHRILGRRARGSPDPHHARWQPRRPHSREHAHLLPYRRAALAGALSGQRCERPAAGQSPRVCLDAARAAGRNGELGTQRHTAPGQPVPANRKSHAPGRGSPGVSRHSGRSIAKDDFFGATGRQAAPAARSRGR